MGLFLEGANLETIPLRMGHYAPRHGIIKQNPIRPSQNRPPPMSLTCPFVILNLKADDAVPITSPPINQKNVHELKPPCSLNTVTPYYPRQGAAHSLEGIHLLWPPLSDKAIKLFFSTSNSVSKFLFSTCEQRPSFSHNGILTKSMNWILIILNRENNREYYFIYIIFSFNRENTCSRNQGFRVWIVPCLLSTRSLTYLCFCSWISRLFRLKILFHKERILLPGETARGH